MIIRCLVISCLIIILCCGRSYADERPDYIQELVKFFQLEDKTQLSDEKLVTQLNNHLLYPFKNIAQQFRATSLVYLFSNEKLGHHHLESLHAWANHADAIFSQNKFDEANNSYQLLLETAKLYHEDNPSLLVMLYNKWANILVLQEEYSDAEFLYKQALFVLNDYGYTDEFFTLTTKKHLAHLYHKVNRQEDANKYLNEVVKGLKIILPKNDPQVLSSEYELGRSYQILGNHEKAVPFLKRAYDVLKVIDEFGEENTFTMTAGNDLALSYNELGYLDEAEKIHLSQIAVRKKVFEKDSLALMLSYHNIALLYLNKNTPERAEYYFDLSIEGRMKKYESNHPDILISKHGLANSYMQQKRYKDAIKLLTDIYHLMKDHPRIGANHPQTMVVVHDIASTYVLMKNYDFGEAFHRQNEINRKKIFNKNSKPVLQTLRALSELYTHRNMMSTAGKYYIEAHDVSKVINKHDSKELFWDKFNLADYYMEVNEYDKSETLFKQAIALNTSETNNLRSKIKLVEIFKETGRNDQSINYASKLNIEYSNYLKNKKKLRIELNYFIAKNYIHKENYSEAKKILVKIDKEMAQKTTFSVNYSFYVSVKNDLSLIYANSGMHTEAEVQYLNALGLAEEKLGKYNLNSVTIMRNLANLYHNQARYLDAEEKYHEAKLVYKKIKPNDLMVINKINESLAKLYIDMGGYNDAEKIYLKITKNQSKDNDDNYYQRVKLAFSRFYVTLGKYREAKDIINSIDRKSLGFNLQLSFSLVETEILIAEGKFRKVHKKSASILHECRQNYDSSQRSLYSCQNDIAELYRQTGKYNDALELHEFTYRERKKRYGDSDKETLQSESNLALLYSDIGRYKDAKKHFDYVINLTEKKFGPAHIRTLTVKENLAGMYTSQGKYGEAENLHMEVINTLLTHYPDDERTLRSVNNYSVLLQKQQKFVDAERELLALRDILKQQSDTNLPLALQVDENLGLLYLRTKRYEGAESMLVPVYKKRLDLFGRENPKTLTTQHNLASLEGAKQQYDKAERLFREVYEVRKKVLGDKHPNTIITLNNIAEVCLKQGKLAESKELLDNALNNTIGLESPLLTLTILENILAVSIFIDPPEEIIINAKEYEKQLSLYLYQEFFTEDNLTNRRQLLRNLSRFMLVINGLVMKHPTPEIKRFAVESLFKWQQVDLEERLVTQHLAQNTDIPDINELMDELQIANANLSRATKQSPTNKPLIRRTLLSIESLEHQLSQYSLTHKQKLASGNVSFMAIKEAIPDNSGLLMVRWYLPFTNTKVLSNTKADARWLGYWVTKNEGQLSIKVVELEKFSSETVKRLFESGSSEQDTAYKLLFEELDQDFAAVERIYLSGDIFLQMTDTSHWRLPDGRFWIERNDIRRLNIARDLLRKAPKSKGVGLVAFGDIDYNDVSLKVAKKISLKSSTHTASGQIKRNSLSGDFSSDPSTAALLHLPGSKQEVKTLKEHFQHFLPESPSQIFTGSKASEAALKQLDLTPRILHFATHAFFSQDTIQLQRPLMSSGLVLANAKKGFEGSVGSDGEDGILYSSEASSLNLQGTELVTLSACSTHLGEIDYTEGVYGLVQAFKIAGVKNILMTLNDIVDDDTPVFMDAFYKHLLKSPNKHPATALRETKLSFIRSKEEYQQRPEFWSPYVLVEMAQ